MYIPKWKTFPITQKPVLCVGCWWKVESFKFYLTSSSSCSGVVWLQFGSQHVFAYILIVIPPSHRRVWTMYGRLGATLLFSINASFAYKFALHLAWDESNFQLLKVTKRKCCAMVRYRYTHTYTNSTLFRTVRNCRASNWNWTHSQWWWWWNDCNHGYCASRSGVVTGSLYLLDEIVGFSSHYKLSGTSFSQLAGLSRC